MRQTTPSPQKPPASKRIKYLSGVLAMLCPLWAGALEIGAPTTNPVLGESLRLEIPLTLPAGSKPPENKCVRLMRRADDSEDDYFPKDMRAAIEARRGAAMLVITSTKGVSSPIIGFRVVIECEAGVARDYILLASQREALGPAKNEATSTPATVEAAPKPVTQNHEMVLSHSTTLNKLARARYPSSRETRDEYRRLMALANPELFANAGDNVGSVPLPAGTVLKLPAELPKKQARNAKETGERPSAEVPQASEGGKPPAGAKADEDPSRAAAGAKMPRKKADRLVIGGGQGRVPSLSQAELKQSLDRLEQMMSDKSRGDQAMSETLTSLAASFGEVKTYLQGVDERIKHAEAEQQRAQTELQSLREELRNSYSLVELLLAIIGGGAVGAGLIVLGQRLAGRRQPAPYAATTYTDTAPSAAPAVEHAPAPAAAAPAAAHVVPQPAAPTERPMSAPASHGSRIEPTTRNTIERATAKEASAATQPIPDKFAALRKPAGEEPAAPPAVEVAATTAASAEENLELELPKVDAPAQDATQAMVVGAGKPQLPDTAAELELKLGDGASEETLAHAVGVDPVIELADVMTSLGLAKEAASAVIEHIRQHPHQDPSHWFKVLEIYRSTGHREAFDEAVQELRQNLNVAVDDWDSEGSKSDRSSLEDYAHISRELQALWPKPECEEFLTKLLEDNRGGKRAGFPQSVAEEIVLLKAILRNAPNIDFPPIGGADAQEDPALAESKAWREVRLIP